MMCCDIKNVENSKLMVYDGHKRKPWTPESDECPGLWENLQKVQRQKIFDPQT